MLVGKHTIQEKQRLLFGKCTRGQVITIDPEVSLPYRRSDRNVTDDHVCALQLETEMYQRAVIHADNTAILHSY